MRLVSIEIGYGLSDPPRVLLDIPDDWDLDDEYRDWYRSKDELRIRINPCNNFAEYLKLHGAKEPTKIERYPPG